MGRIEQLAEQYERFIEPLWQRNIAGAEKTIFIVYPRGDERKLRTRRHEFELRTRNAGKSWREYDFTNSFPTWMAADEYREAFFECPEDLSMKLGTEFTDYAAAQLLEVLTGEGVDEDSVVGVFGAATLFGLTTLSAVLTRIEVNIRGRLLVFFPGEYENNNFRLLDARDGWNYLAVPITLHHGDID